MRLEELRREYKRREKEIKKRFEEFKKTWRNEEAVFQELIFCLLTPQSKAKLCWQAVGRLGEKGLIGSRNVKAIEMELSGVRFKRNKARFVSDAARLRGKLKKTLESFRTPQEAREWLVKNVRGFGYKEASHFLRNIGYSDELAILDRHILKNLKKFGVIKEIPKTLSRRKYLEVEERMKRFSQRVGIPMSHLDLLFWSMETGEVFK